MNLEISQMHGSARRCSLRHDFTNDVELVVHGGLTN